jgi:hypothetical protein
MRAQRLPLPLALGAALLSPAALAQDDPSPRIRESVERFERQREQTVNTALRALDSGDPLESALALIGAIETVGKDSALVDALSAVKQPAAQAAAARVERLLNEGNPVDALALLARLRVGVASDELDALIDRATVAQRLNESARFEAEGQKADAMRAAVLAANVAPNDPRVVAAMTRLGLKTAATPSTVPTTGAQATPTSSPDDRLTTLEREVRTLRESRELGGGGSDAALRAMTRIDSLEVQIRSLEGVVERYARSLADIESRQRIDGRAEYATDELDRRVRDLERRINDFDRSISRLESDIRDLNRRIDRVR